MGKLTMLAGVGVGYVLGTRAGRERYEKIRGTAQRLWQDPRVQEKTQQAATMAKEQGAHAKDVVQEKVGSQSNGTEPSAGGPGGSGSTLP